MYKEKQLREQFIDKVERLKREAIANQYKVVGAALRPRFVGRGQN
jgi:hypothetical protein